MRADHSFTLLVAVDQIWHLHLVYAQSYGKKLCTVRSLRLDAARL
jgi:hypothetical protein